MRYRTVPGLAPGRRIRSLGSAPDAGLAQELTRQLTDLQHSGSEAISYHKAAAWLRTQRKKQEALLTPDLEQQILDRQHTLAQLNARLQNTSFQERKAAIQIDLDDCLEQLASLATPEPIPNGQVFTSGDISSQSFGHRSVFRHPILLFTGIFLTISTAILWFGQYKTAAIVSGALALLFLLIGLRRHPAPLSDDEEESDSFELSDIDDDQSWCDHASASDPRIRRLRTRIQDLQRQYEAVCRQEWDHDNLLEQAHTLEEELEQLTLRQTREDEIRLEIQAISLANSTLQKLSDQMQDNIGPALDREMSRILAGLTEGAYSQVFVDGLLHVSLQAGSPNNEMSSSRIVPLESLSRGTIEQVYLAMRLAVIDLLFPQGGMPLILDDCFLTYDDDRLTAALAWLAENYSGQVLIFTCQKREAALLHKEQIPFTHIVL